MEVGVSYFIGANHRGNGYAAEALKCFIEYGEKTENHENEKYTL